MLNEANEYIKTCQLPTEFCCLINSHDNTNVRTPAYNALKQLGHITCPGRLYNNCSNEEVNRIGKNDYLKRFKFNICSENTLDYPGYITEKLLECCFGGAIPIYAGNYDDIDDKIYNEDRILFYDPRDENSIQQIIEIVEIFLANESLFEIFYRQQIFRDGAADVILDLEDQLISKIQSLI